MLENNQIEMIKELRKQGFSFNKIAKKMNFSVKTVTKYCKEEGREEEPINEESQIKKLVETKDSVEERHVQELKEDPLTFRENFNFIRAEKDCKARIDRLKIKQYGPYNHEVKIFIAKYEYVLILMEGRDPEGLEALKYLDGEYRRFDADCEIAASVRGDIVKLKRERAQEQEENKDQEKKFKNMVMEKRRLLMAYDHKIAKKKENYEKLKVEYDTLEEMKASGQRAVANIIEEGKKEAQYWDKQIENLRHRYNTTLEFGEMVELTPMLENTITQLTGQLRDLNDIVTLQENREVLRKPLENMVEVVDVMPLDLFKKLCAAVEKRKATEPAFVQQEMVQRMQSNQPFTRDSMYQMMMTEMAKAMNSGDELDEIIELRKLKEMTKS